MTEKYTWLHIGLGSFHRAHQAWYLHRLIAAWRYALAHRCGQHTQRC